ncbi:MAG: trehalose-6-phosphate synthase [Methanobacterium sp.]|uniref:alpha,alpha-trehalose-phosphate synthase (UDP-forming) n=1 Tax=Methanobacterium sp. TaxID=2164 RepID=UPI003D65E86D|nr:trehalose-6-phosphate synthase [Methanobacterium sp.]
MNSEFIQDKEIIVASNRGPVLFKRDGNGKLELIRGKGGIVGSMIPFLEKTHGKWVSSAIGECDHHINDKYDSKIPIPLENPEYYIQLIKTEEDVYNRFNGKFANPLLWFIHHSMWNPPYSPCADDELHHAWDSYQYVNTKFAEAIGEDAYNSEKTPIVMLQDYHLYLTPKLIRKQHPDVLMSQFVHIPFPPPEIFQQLPNHMQIEILDSMLTNDVLGFHISRYMNNFFQTIKLILPNALVNEILGDIIYNGHVCHVRTYPISVDVKTLQKHAQDPNVIGKESEVDEIVGDCKLIYRTDRADLSKNIIRGFQAYDMFLEKYPEWREKVKFVATLMPSRQDIKIYREYTDKIMDVVNEINDKYATPDWEPIKYIFKGDYDLVTALFKRYDVLMVNPILDGMNIVAKEGSVVNENNGVLILSTGAGCYEELKDGAICINPFDLRQTAESIDNALLMDEETKSQMIKNARAVLEKNDLNKWVSDQLKDIETVMYERGSLKSKKPEEARFEMN